MASVVQSEPTLLEKRNNAYVIYFKICSQLDSLEKDLKTWNMDSKSPEIADLISKIEKERDFYYAQANDYNNKIVFEREQGASVEKIIEKYSEFVI